MAIGPPGLPPGCRGRITEHARLEWRIGDPGDPARLLEDVLTCHGLPAADLAAPPGADRCGPPGTVCGAAVLISAAGCNVIAGLPPGPATPAPGIPDLAVVVYAHTAGPPAAANAAASPEAAVVGPWRPSWTPAAHAAAVERVRQAIGRGEVYQVNVVGHRSAPLRGDPAAALLPITRLPGARYAGYLEGAGWAVASASPETLLTVHDGTVQTRPIKGTRPATPWGHSELTGSEKERAEHVMIVDLERNDLSRVARTGTVRVTELFEVRRWCDLWQAESVVSADLAPGTGIGPLLAALCPGGSVTGAPKIAALDLIAGLEPVGRGPSMGAFGYVTPYRVDLGLTIRTVAVDGERVHLWAGGGITWGSDPASEVAEADAKAAPLLSALGAPDVRRSATR